MPSYMDVQSGESNKPQKTYKNTTLSTVGWFLIIVVLFALFRHTEGIEYSIADHTLEVTYTEQTLREVKNSVSIELPIEDIISIELVETEDIGSLIEGIETKKCSAGSFSSDTYGDLEVCIYNNVSEKMLAVTSDGYYLFNLEDDATTESFYESFVENKDEL